MNSQLIGLHSSIWQGAVRFVPLILCVLLITSLFGHTAAFSYSSSPSLDQWKSGEHVPPSNSEKIRDVGSVYYDRDDNALGTTFVNISTISDLPRTGATNYTKTIIGTVDVPPSDTLDVVHVSVNNVSTFNVSVSQPDSTLTTYDYEFSFNYTFTDRINTVNVSAITNDGAADYDVLRMDGDGLPGEYEWEVSGTDALDPDSDFPETSVNESNNGVSDGAEDVDDDGVNNWREWKFGLDTYDPDVDDDGLEDGLELSTAGLSPTSLDSDGDLTFDGQEDFDNDGLTNLEEQQAGTSLQNYDTDGDGLNDTWEINSGPTDPLDKDSDDDGLSDGTEYEVEPQTDPLDSDTDGDGIDDFNETLVSSADIGLGVHVEAVGTGPVAKGMFAINGSRYFPRTTAVENASASDIISLDSRSEFESANISISYDDQDVQNESALAVYQFNQTIRTFEPLDSTIDPTQDLIWATVSEESVLVVLETPVWVATFPEMPNPWSTNVTYANESDSGECSQDCTVTNGTLVVGERNTDNVSSGNTFGGNHSVHEEDTLAGFSQQTSSSDPSPASDTSDNFTIHISGPTTVETSIDNVRTYTVHHNRNESEIASYNWSQYLNTGTDGSCDNPLGPAYFVDDNENKSVKYTYQYYYSCWIWHVNVTLDNGEFATENLTVNIKYGPTPDPYIKGPQTVEVGQEYQYEVRDRNDQNVHADPISAGYNWWVNGGKQEHESENNYTYLYYTFPVEGTYHIVADVYYENGVWKEREISVTAQSSDSGQSNGPTAAITGPSTGTVGEEIRFDASLSTDDEAIASYRWAIKTQEGKWFNTTSPGSATYSGIANDPGDYVVEVIVVDNEEQTHTASQSFTISPKYPDVHQLPVTLVGKNSSFIGENVMFSVTSTEDNSAYTYDWRIRRPESGAWYDVPSTEESGAEYSGRVTQEGLYTVEVFVQNTETQEKSRLRTAFFVLDDDSGLRERTRVAETVAVPENVSSASLTTQVRGVALNAEARLLLVTHDSREELFSVQSQTGHLKTTYQEITTNVTSYAGKNVSLVVDYAGRANIQIDNVRTTIDTDGDGLSDGLERGGIPIGLGYSVRTDPTRRDTDDDLLDDNEEIGDRIDLGFIDFYLMNTHPSNSDTDNDGLTDHEEFRVWDSSPTCSDSDSDGYDDFIDPAATTENTPPKIEIEKNGTFNRYVTVTASDVSSIESIEVNAYYDPEASDPYWTTNHEITVFNEADYEKTYGIGLKGHGEANEPSKKYFINVTDEHGNAANLRVTPVNQGSEAEVNVSLEWAAGMGVASNVGRKVLGTPKGFVLTVVVGSIVVDLARRAVREVHKEAQGDGSTTNVGPSYEDMPVLPPTTVKKTYSEAVTPPEFEEIVLYTGILKEKYDPVRDSTRRRGYAWDLISVSLTEEMVDDAITGNYPILNKEDFAIIIGSGFALVILTSSDEGEVAEKEWENEHYDEVCEEHLYWDNNDMDHATRSEKKINDKTEIENTIKNPVSRWTRKTPKEFVDRRRYYIGRAGPNEWYAVMFVLLDGVWVLDTVYYKKVKGSNYFWNSQKEIEKWVKNNGGNEGC